MHKFGITAVVAVLLVVMAISGAAASDDQDQALIEAAGKNDLKQVRVLLDKGANVNARSELGWTALMKASANGHLEAVKLLLDKGADVNAKDYEGTALIKASSFGRLGVVSLLLKRGSDANATDREGRTAMMVVCKEGDKDAEKAIENLLIAHGAATTTEGSESMASDRAINTGLVDTWELLYQTDEQGKNEAKTLQGTRTLIELTNKGVIIFNKADNGNSNQMKSRTGRYRIEGDEILITDDKGNTVRWPYQITDNKLIISMPEVKKKFHWQRIR